MRIHQNPEFQQNLRDYFNNNLRNYQREPCSIRPWRPWDVPRPPERPQERPEGPPRRPERPNRDTLEPIPYPFNGFTTDNQMSPVNRGELLALKGTYYEKIRKYVRDRWPILGSFHDRTNLWGRCFLKCKYFTFLNPFHLQ